MGPGRGGSGGPDASQSREEAAWARPACGEGRPRPHRSGPLTEDCFHQPGLQVNCPRTLQVLGVKPVGPLGEVTEHLEERPFSLLQLNKRRKPLGGGHAAASLAGGCGSAANRRPRVRPAAARVPRSYIQGFRQAPPSPAPSSLDSRPRLRNPQPGLLARKAQLRWGARPERSRWAVASGSCRFPERQARGHNREAAEALTVDAGRPGRTRRRREDPTSGRQLSEERIGICRDPGAFQTVLRGPV